MTTDHKFSRRSMLKGTGASVALLGVPAALGEAEIATRYNYAPQLRNMPVGVARGVFPGRVAWAHDPKATRWSGHIESATDLWWTDANTDQARVDAMVSAVLRHVTGAGSDEQAWQILFTYYNQRARGLNARGYRAGELVAVKVNLNNSNPINPGNIVNVSPQTALAVVRQLVEHARVPPAHIVVYDAQRDIYPGLLTKIWKAYPAVRFVQKGAPDPEHQIHPVYGGTPGLEQAQWVEGVSYSANDYRDAKLIPQQVMDATYLVNVALLKAHS